MGTIQFGFENGQVDDDQPFWFGNDKDYSLRYLSDQDQFAIRHESSGTDSIVVDNNGDVSFNGSVSSDIETFDSGTSLTTTTKSLDFANNLTASESSDNVTIDAIQKAISASDDGTEIEADIDEIDFGSNLSASSTSGTVTVDATASGSADVVPNEDTRVNMVTDEGVDDSGTTDVAGTLETVLGRDNHEAYFPSGEYLVESEISVGSIASGTITMHPDAKFVAGDMSSVGDNWMTITADEFRMYNVTYDITSDGTSPQASISVNNSGEIVGIEYVGQTAGVGSAALDVAVLESSLINTPDSDTLDYDATQISTSGSGFVIEDAYLPDGSPDASGETAIYVGPNNEGRVTVRNSYMEGWTDNAIYAANGSGPIVLDSNTAVNGIGSHFRVGQPYSVVRNNVSLWTIDNAGFAYRATQGGTGTTSAGISEGGGLFENNYALITAAGPTAMGTDSTTLGYRFEGNKIVMDGSADGYLCRVQSYDGSFGPRNAMDIRNNTFVNNRGGGFAAISVEREQTQWINNTVRSSNGDDVRFQGGASNCYIRGGDFGGSNPDTLDISSDVDHVHIDHPSPVDLESQSNFSDSSGTTIIRSLGKNTGEMKLLADAGGDWKGKELEGQLVADPTDGQMWTRLDGSLFTFGKPASGADTVSSGTTVTSYGSYTPVSYKLDTGGDTSGSGTFELNDDSATHSNTITVKNVGSGADIDVVTGTTDSNFAEPVTVPQGGRAEFIAEDMGGSFTWFLRNQQS